MFTAKTDVYLNSLANRVRLAHGQLSQVPGKGADTTKTLPDPYPHKLEKEQGFLRGTFF